MSLYSKDAVGDLVLLETIDEQNILTTLKKRHARDLIYTHIGNVLLSVNPFKDIGGLYSESQIAAYRGRYIYENPPHIFGLAEDTYRALCTEGDDQCVIISGESGAGQPINQESEARQMGGGGGDGTTRLRTHTHSRLSLYDMYAGKVTFPSTCLQSALLLAR